MRSLCQAVVFAAAVMTAAAEANQSASKPLGSLSEQDYEALMKKVSPAFAMMSENLDKGELDRAVEGAQQLRQLFAEVEKFWTEHKRGDAAKYALAAGRLADEVATGVTAARGYLKSDARIQTGVQARLSRARASAEVMGAVCQRCHTAYREGEVSGGFRIKPGALVP